MKICGCLTVPYHILKIKSFFKKTNTFSSLFYISLFYTPFSFISHLFIKHLHARLSSLGADRLDSKGDKKDKSSEISNTKVQKQDAQGSVYLVVFEVPKAGFKEEDSFQENLEGRQFGCKVNSRKQHSRKGDYWASLQRCGKNRPVGGDSRKFDLAGSGSSKRNRLGNTRAKKDVLS